MSASVAYCIGEPCRLTTPNLTWIFALTRSSFQHYSTLLFSHGRGVTKIFLRPARLIIHPSIAILM